MILIPCTTEYLQFYDDLLQETRRISRVACEQAHKINAQAAISLRQQAGSCSQLSPLTRYCESARRLFQEKQDGLVQFWVTYNHVIIPEKQD